MTPLADLLAKWQDQNLTAAEQTELNAWLGTAEGRAQAREAFAFEARLREAVQVDKARAETQAQARAFETLGLDQNEFAGSLPRLIWRLLTGARWRIALLALATVAGLSAVFVFGQRKEVIARLECDAPGAVISRGAKAIAAGTGFGLQSGDQIQTSDTVGARVVYLQEPTRLELQNNTRLQLEAGATGKRLELFLGALTAKVAPQPKGLPLLAVTPHAEARVLGTEFSLTAGAQSSRLEVFAGVVEFVSRDDGKAVMVSGGSSATAARGLELAAQSLLPAPWYSQDIGEVGLPGVARLDGNRCTAKGAGHNTCRTKDQFHFVYQPLDDDGEIIARVVNLERARPGAKAGVMVRANLKPSSPHAFLFLRPGGGVEFERRASIESKTDHAGAGVAPCWLRLARHGNAITAYQSTDGATWTPTGSETIKLDARIYVGLGVTSWDNTTLATSVFDNVRVNTATTP